MASAFPGQVSAVQVGSFFLGQYYPFLQRTPSLVHQFYTNASTMIRYDGDASERASGMAEIHNLIVRLNFIEIEILAAHSLESWGGGVLVNVTGFVQVRDFIFRRKFVETFFLAPQEKGYFVLNDIFLLLEEEQVHLPPAAILRPTDYDTKLDALNYDTRLDTFNHLQDPVSSYMLGEDIPARDFISPPVPADENNQLDNYSVPGHRNQTPDPNETTDETPIELAGSSVSTVQNIVQYPAITEEEPAEERPKLSYASILRTTKAQVAPQLTSVNKTAPNLSDWHPAQQATQQQVQAAISSLPDKSNADLPDETFAFEDEVESKSVYVGNLPASISTFDLEQEFRNFGRIKPDGVTIRSRKEAGVFYAFIEFEDAVAVQNALKATPVQLNGRMIHVEGRRPNSGASRGGRKGRGRGGYYLEPPRGRFGGRSFGGRFGGLDRPRGNGYIPRLPRQERGILGSHFSKNGGNQSEALAS
ncbi:putative G3BP-like protein [Phalaenopsis equestris]|uniref:putative G3BP-like protein n=1 Tax=Phalaenopsis equestris TaxID=78828 RepID=UPI0009E2D8D1|nr:putative G3BP-like protein [Phalaenopsis equestris]